MEEIKKLNDLAIEYAKGGRWDSEALELNKKIIALNNENIAAYTRAAKCYANLQQDSKAIEMYSMVLEKDPKNTIAKNNLKRIEEKLQSFCINKNNFLNIDIKAYFHQYYTGYMQPDNPDFLNLLKNTYDDEKWSALSEAQEIVVDILLTDLPLIIKKTGFSGALLLCVPRAKKTTSYSKNQLMFLEGVQIAAQSISDIEDGTGCIKRIKDTRTTHLKKSDFEGPLPYPGITLETCLIEEERIKNRKIILVDDIYTRTVNIDEDCIQALLDLGAQEVIFYSIGYTRRK